MSEDTITSCPKEERSTNWISGLEDYFSEVFDQNWGFLQLQDYIHCKPKKLQKRQNSCLSNGFTKNFLKGYRLQPLVVTAHLTAKEWKKASII